MICFFFVQINNIHKIIRITFTVQIPIHVLKLWHSYNLENETSSNMLIWHLACWKELYWQKVS